MQSYSIKALLIAWALLWTTPCFAAVALVGGSCTTGCTAGGISGAPPQTVTATMPSGPIVLGNEIVCFFVASVNTVSDASMPPKPFVKVGATSSTNDGWFIDVYRRISDGTEGSSQIFDAGVGNVIAEWGCRAYSGENQTTPEDSGGNSTNVGNSGTTANVTGITTGTNAEAVFIALDTTTIFTFGTPSGFANASTDNTGFTSGTFDKTNSGATGSVSASGVTSTDNWAAFLFAIAPAVNTAQPGIVILQ